LTGAAGSAQPPANAATVVGFDRNGYPGDARLKDLHQHFAFVGYWLNNPPGARSNGWLGKRRLLREAGFGFAVLWNGLLDAEIKRSATTAVALGQRDAAAAAQAAHREGFPPHTFLFLDQEEGGRLLPEQADYFFAWTEAVAAAGFVPGAYVSGQPVPDGTGPEGKPATITTAAFVRQQVAARKLHPVALWIAQDACPPAPGCRAAPAPRPDDSGTLDTTIWQYAQSPRRPAVTATCAQTYAPDNMCYGGASTDLFLDLDVAQSADPSHGR
jgi:hypothetical protein